MKTSVLYAPIAGFALLFTGGCEGRVDTAPPSPPTADSGSRVDVDIDVDSTPADRQEARSERREERRENLRERIDNVDVEVDRDGVDVKVD